MKLVIRFFCLVCWLVSLSTNAANHATLDQPQVKITYREHGYHLGDMLVQQVVVAHSQTQTVDKKSLLLPGPVKPWLDLKSVALAPADGGTSITVTWQLFATVETSQLLTLPSWTLMLSGMPSVMVKVPATQFYHSPVLVSNVTQVERKRSRPPLMYDLRRWQWLTIASLSLSLGIAALALWIQDQLPWLPFRPGPLCRAQRRLRQGHASAEASLAMVYHGLCELAGVTLHKRNMSLLLANAPYLQPVQQEVEAFIHRYNDYQFEYQPLLSPRAFQREEVGDLLMQVGQWLPQAALLERAFKASIVT